MTTYLLEWPNLKTVTSASEDREKLDHSHISGESVK